MTGGFSGELTHFKVHSCDEFGNQLLTGGDVYLFHFIINYSWLIIIRYDIKVTGPTTPHVLATDNMDGTYLVKFLANKSGTYMIHILFNVILFFYYY